MGRVKEKTCPTFRDRSDRSASTKAAITAILNRKIEDLWQNFSKDQLHQESHRFFHTPSRCPHPLLPRLSPLVIYLPTHNMSDDGGDDQ